MLNFQEVLDKIQSDILNISDQAVRTRAQSQFELLPRDPSLWYVSSSTTRLDYTKKGLSATASKEEIEAAYQKGVEQEAQEYAGIVDREQFENLKKPKDLDNDINFETTITKSPKGASVDNSETYHFNISATSKNSAFTIEHNKGTADDVMRYGKHKKWGVYDKSTNSTRRQGVYMTQDVYTMTNSDGDGVKPKATDIYDKTTQFSFDESLEKEKNKKHSYTQYLDDKLHISEVSDSTEKGTKTTTRTEETKYGPLLWDKTIKTEEHDNIWHETKVLSKEDSYGFISDVEPAKQTAEEAAKQLAAIDAEVAKMDEKAQAKDSIDNMPLVNGKDANDKMEYKAATDTNDKNTLEFGQMTK